jgi:hypothetical protein
MSARYAGVLDLLCGPNEPFTADEQVMHVAALRARRHTSAWMSLAVKLTKPPEQQAGCAAALPAARADVRLNALSVTVRSRSGGTNHFHVGSRPRRAVISLDLRGRTRIAGRTVSAPGGPSIRRLAQR